MKGRKEVGKGRDMGSASLDHPVEGFSHHRDVYAEFFARFGQVAEAKQGGATSFVGG